jgi:hypothetical protein
MGNRGGFCLWGGGKPKVACSAPLAAAIAVAMWDAGPCPTVALQATVIARPPFGGRFSPTGADVALLGLARLSVQPNRFHTVGGEAAPRLAPPGPEVDRTEQVPSKAVPR